MNKNRTHFRACPKWRVSRPFCFCDFITSTRSKLIEIMGASALAIIFFTGIWGGVGIVLPFFVPKGPNRGILQLVLMLTAATCWLFWLCCYMAQMNPLIGPKLDNKTILLIAKEWDLVPLE